MKFRDILSHTDYFDGLVVLDDATIHMLQDTLTEMQNELAEVFEKHNIAWGITGGNALGAVRNKDFIPWDDDIDINISREDYRKLESIFDEELGDRYELKKPGDRDYVYHFPQIHKKNTTYQLLQSKENAANGLFIDLFVVENTFKNPLMHLLHGLGCTFFLFVDSALRVHACKNNLLKYCVNEKAKKVIIKKTVMALPFRFLPLEKWLSLSDRWFALSNNRSSDRVVIPSGARHFWGEIYPREVILPFRETVFRNNKWYTLNRVEKYLSVRYGADYMTPPAEAQKEKHTVVAISL